MPATRGTRDPRRRATTARLPRPRAASAAPASSAPRFAPSSAARIIASPPSACTLNIAHAESRDVGARPLDRVRDVVQLAVHEYRAMRSRCAARRLGRRPRTARTRSSACRPRERAPPRAAPPRRDPRRRAPRSAAVRGSRDHASAPRSPAAPAVAAASATTSDRRFSSATMPCAIDTGADGSINAATPTWTALAPASSASIASRRRCDAAARDQRHPRQRARDVGDRAQRERFERGTRQPARPATERRAQRRRVDRIARAANRSASARSLPRARRRSRSAPRRGLRAPSRTRARATSGRPRRRSRSRDPRAHRASAVPARHRARTDRPRSRGPRAVLGARSVSRTYSSSEPPPIGHDHGAPTFVQDGSSAAMNASMPGFCRPGIPHDARLATRRSGAARSLAGLDGDRARHDAADLAEFDQPGRALVLSRRSPRRSSTGVGRIRPPRSTASERRCALMRPPRPGQLDVGARRWRPRASGPTARAPG